MIKESSLSPKPLHSLFDLNIYDGISGENLRLEKLKPKSTKLEFSILELRLEFQRMLALHYKAGQARLFYSLWSLKTGLRAINS